MKLPFTTQEFFKVFENYNNTVFPIQFMLYTLAITAIFYVFKKTPVSDKIISAVLSFFWLWMGIVYHLIFFTAINKAAYIFGAFFILQGILFLWMGVVKNKLSFHFSNNVYGLTAFSLMAYALIVYPAIGYLSGHVFPASPTFGLPCPTTIFTLGMLLVTDKKYPVIIYTIPFLWSLIGFMAALSLGIKEDTGLLVAVVCVTWLMTVRNRKVNSQKMRSVT